MVLDDGIMGAVHEADEGHGWERVAHAFDRVTPDHAFDVVRGLFGACATNLSDGNTEVFAEIAPAAATFIECFGAQPLDARSVRARVLQVTDGVPEFEGVNRLRAGFSLWCDALSESDPKRRSQLVLVGSLDLGAHEQNHLQGAIAGRMDMGMDQSVHLLSQRLAKEGHAGAELDESATDGLHPVARCIGALWGDLMTELLGSIETPDGVLRLDCDLPLLPGRHGGEPAG